MNAIVLVFVAFALMEPAAYLAHRLVMHGRLGGWHRGHHQVRITTFESNDLYPLVAAAITVVLIALGTVVERAASDGERQLPRTVRARPRRARSTDQHPDRTTE